MNLLKVRSMLDEAQKFADASSGCEKVTVGSVLCLKKSNQEFVIFGSNRTLPVSCKKEGCQRKALYGEDSKNHRLPSDCRAIHSEIDAITSAARFGFSTKDAVMIITRYPCEACARAIVASGIRKVYYGRKQEISQQTKDIFDEGGVGVEWVKGWSYEDVED